MRLPAHFSSHGSRGDSSVGAVTAGQRAPSSQESKPPPMRPKQVAGVFGELGAYSSRPPNATEGEEAEAQRRKDTSPRSHSFCEVDLVLEPRRYDLGAQAQLPTPLTLAPCCSKSQRGSISASSMNTKTARWVTRELETSLPTHHPPLLQLPDLSRPVRGGCWGGDSIGPGAE